MIYDCFSFFNELDLLEIRLNVLKEVVDKFVLVEATQTHTGNPKPLYYQENKARFAAFADKIIHIVVNDFPVPPANYTERQASWMRENFQRNAIMRGLTEAKGDDLILISDLDEIPNPNAIVRASTYKDGITALGLEIFCYYLNVKNYTHYEITCTRALRYKTLLDPLRYKTMPPNRNRDSIVNAGATTTNARYTRSDRVLKNAGWHFSYLGGVKAISKKIDAIAIEYADEKSFNETWLAETISRGEDITGCGGRYFAVQLNKRFPAYIRNNQMRYSSLIYAPEADYFQRTRIPRLKSFLRGWIRKNGSVLIPQPCKGWLYHHVYCRIVKEPIAM